MKMDNKSQYTENKCSNDNKYTLLIK